VTTKSGQGCTEKRVDMKRMSAAALLWSSCLAMLTIGVNSTAIMAALPTMRTELLLGSAGLQWAVNAYLVVAAACIVPGGHAADWFGARRTSMLGLAMLAIASCVIAAAGTQAELIAGRALQGFAAALAVPGTLAAVSTGAPPERRTAAIGAWTGFLMLGFSIGPLLGGALTHFVSWRMIFVLNVPLTLVAIAGIASAGAATPVANAGPPPRADWLGFLLSGTFMVALVFTLQSAPRATVAPASFIAPFAVAAAALLLLLAAEARAKAPLVDLTFFRHRPLVMGVAIGSLGMFSILSFLLYFNLYAQGRDGPGFTALEAGASLLPLSGVLLAIALSASAIAARIGLRYAMAAGMVLLAIASAIVAVAVEQGWIVILLVGLALIGAGLALPYAVAPRLALSALAPAQTGQGSGIVNACTFLSGSAGVACGAIAFAAGGFVAVLTMIALIAIAGAALSYAIAETG
jgi:MFS family permease